MSILTARSVRENSFCFALTGLILFFPAALLPLVSASELGNRRSSQLLTGIAALWHDQMHLLATVVLFCGAIFPLALLLALLVLHGPPALQRWSARQPLVVQSARLLRTWAFPEVQVLAVIVGVIKLHSLVDLQIDAGFWCYCGMTAALLIARRGFDASAGSEEIAGDGGGTNLQIRKDRTQCIALASAAVVLLFPANLLPVLHTETSGDNRTDTIFTGARELARQGLWGLAAIVFTASIVIPGLKLIGLAVLLYRDGRPGPARRAALGRIYAFLLFIGRWSMLDVFLAGFLVGLVAFGEFATVRAQDGLIAFAAVVVLTILATESFDPREIT